MVEHRAGWLDPVFVALSHAGSYGALWLGLALVVATLDRRPAVLLATGGSLLVAELLARAVKEAVGRDRPPEHVPGLDPLVGVPGSPSFPSGHAASSFAAALVLSRFYPRLAVGLFLLAAAVAYSRVYVGVHYPLDAAAGAALGLACATALHLLAKARRRSRPGRRPGPPTSR
mgnify:CR=1 FL=1